MNTFLSDWYSFTLKYVKYIFNSQVEKSRNCQLLCCSHARLCCSEILDKNKLRRETIIDCTSKFSTELTIQENQLSRTMDSNDKHGLWREQRTVPPKSKPKQKPKNISRFMAEPLPSQYSPHNARVCVCVTLCVRDSGWVAGWVSYFLCDLMW